MENLTFLEVWNMIKEVIKNLAFVGIIFGVFFEIVPIKIHPIQWLIKFIFKPVRKDIEGMKKEFGEKIEALDKKIDHNQEKVYEQMGAINEYISGIDVKLDSVREDIDSLKGSVNEHENKIQELLTAQDMDSIARIRWEILEFANAIENGQRRTRDSFLLCKDQYKRYHVLLDRHGMSNGLLDDEMNKINKYYEEHKDSSSFYI